MSTRSVIAVSHGDGWRGVYCHFDGYPTHQGPAIWAMLTKTGFDREAFASTYIDPHPCGFRMLKGAKKPECYCHHANGKRRKDYQEYLTPYTEKDEKGAAGIIEYVYVVGRHALTVYGYRYVNTAHDSEWVALGTYAFGTEPPWDTLETHASELWREAYTRLFPHDPL